MESWWTHVDEEINAEELVEIMRCLHNGKEWRLRDILAIEASGCYVKVYFIREESLVLKISAEG